MGKIEYYYNPASQYKNGYAAGYEKGKNEAFNSTVELALKSVMISLWHAGWDAENLKTMRDMIVELILYNAKVPQDIDYLLEEMEKDTGVKITFDGESHEQD